ncbi:hypothetical protein XELAEV_18001716mg [Xenopus laevis]|nr:hypothetical protein XELAEV_18001716mg [Xenopus laevis]
MEQIQMEEPEMERALDSEMDVIQKSFPIPLQRVPSKLADHLDKFRSEVEAWKRTKFQRDAADYATGRVYRWSYSMDALSHNQRSSRPARTGGEDLRDQSRSTSASTSSSFLGGSQAMGTASEDGGAVEGSATQKQKRANRQHRRPNIKHYTD